MARGLADFSAARLRALRTSTRLRPDATAMTAEQLARAVGTTKAQILAYENGYRVPDPPRLRDLAAALGVPPSALMDHEALASGDVAVMRRACGLRARDVVERLGISPKIYRRFENEGIIPSRRTRFLDDVAAIFCISRPRLEEAIDNAPAVRRRQRRAAKLVEELAKRYVSARGAWKGPATDDECLIELAESYGRPVQRLRRVLTYELGELRMWRVREERERVIADYDPDRSRQANANLAMVRWRAIYDRELSRIPHRLEQFHRNAQPSSNWQMLVELFDVDARPPRVEGSSRAEGGWWCVAKLLSDDFALLPPHLVRLHRIDGVPVCRLTVAGLKHINTFAGLYAALYPSTRRPLRPTTGPLHVPRSRPHHTVETFSLPNHSARLVIPQPALEACRAKVVSTRNYVTVELSPQRLLTIGPGSLAVLELYSSRQSSIFEEDWLNSPDVD